MRVSLSVTNFSWPDGPASITRHLAEVAQAAEDGGLDTVWVVDHPVQSDPASSWDEPILEAYTALGFLAGQTSRVRLGTLVTGATFRTPALLVKSVTTLDVLSGGRAWLGIGSGYNEDEARAMGIDLPPVHERFERLAETLQIADRMWAGDESAYAGRHHRLERPVNRPLPLSKPRPRVLIGGMGEQRTLRLVAEYADACNLFDIPDGGRTVRHKLDVLRQHCADLGRSYDEIEKTITTAVQPAESTDQLTERFEALAAVGIDHVVTITRGRPWTPESVAVLAGTVPALAA